jgi:hypothetical protein
MELTDFQGAYNTLLDPAGQPSPSLSPMIIYPDGSVYICGTAVQVGYDGYKLTLPAFNINGIDVLGGMLQFIPGTNPQSFGGQLIFRDEPTLRGYQGSSMYAFPAPSLENSIDMTLAFDDGDGLKLQASNQNWIEVGETGVVSATAPAKPDAWLPVTVVGWASETPAIAIGNSGSYWVAGNDGVLHASATAPIRATLFYALVTLDGNILLQSLGDGLYLQLSNNSLILGNASSLTTNLKFQGEAQVVDSDTLMTRWNVTRDSAALTQCDTDKLTLCWQLTGGIFLAVGLGPYLLSSTDSVRTGLQGLLRSFPTVWAEIEIFFTNPLVQVTAIAAFAEKILILAYQVGLLWKLIKFLLLQVGWRILFNLFASILTIVLAPGAEAIEILASLGVWTVSLANTAGAIWQDCLHSSPPALPEGFTPELT